MKGKLKKISINGKEFFKNTNTGKLYGEARTVITRKIARNIAKKALGKNKIQRMWRNSQIEKYGISKWCYMFNKCNRNNKTNYITPKEAKGGYVL